MAVCYDANIITGLERNSYIFLESIEKICAALECTVDEILDSDADDNGDQS